MGNLEFKFGDEIQDPDVGQVRDLSRSLIQSFYGDPKTEDFGELPEEDEEVCGAINRRVGKIMAMLKNNDSIVAMDNGKIIGVGGVGLWGRTKDGRAILEISNASVSPRYRGKKIGLEMYKRGMRRVEEKYPNAVLLGFSRNDIIIDAARARGYKVISYDEYVELTGDGLVGNDRAELMRDGYVALMKDPLNPTGKVERISGAARLATRMVMKKLGRGR